MLKAIIKKLEGRVELPIEVSEIAHAIIEAGYQDEIHFVPVDVDKAVIHGAFVKFRYNTGPYRDSIWVCHIPYNSNDTVAWQRMTCCKELVHIFDTELECTDTESEVPDFISKILGPVSSEDYGLADFAVTKDKVALYQALSFLMPKAALKVAREAVKSGIKTPEEVAEWAVMPAALVRLMLNDQWETINGFLFPEGGD